MKSLKINKPIWNCRISISKFTFKEQKKLKFLSIFFPKIIGHFEFLNINLRFGINDLQWSEKTFMPFSTLCIFGEDFHHFEPMPISPILFLQEMWITEINVQCWKVSFKIQLLHNFFIKNRNLRLLRKSRELIINVRH